MSETKVARVNRMTEFEGDLQAVLDSVIELRTKVWRIRTLTSARMCEEPWSSQCGYPTDDGVDWNEVGDQYGDSLPWTDTLDRVKKQLEYLQDVQKKARLK